MKAVSREKMQEIDLRAQKEFGIPGMILMEQAGERATAFLLEKFGSGAFYVVLAGCGKNGGDALVVSRCLFLAGAKVRTFLVGDEAKLAEETRINLGIFESLGGQVERASGITAELKNSLEYCDVVVDGLVGIGLKGDLKDPYGKIVKLLNAGDASVVSLDIPTGIDATTGAVLKEAVLADYTVTFGLPKLGFCLYPGAGFAGEVIIEPLSFPPALLNDASIKGHLIDIEEIADLPRPENSHKGTFGKGLVIAGSLGMAGAAALAGKAALRTGAGLVQALAKKEVLSILQNLVPEMTVKDANSSFDINGYNCLMIGPGMGVTEENAELLKTAIAEAKVKDIPLVLDADALTLVARYGLLTAENHGPVIITPHPGEMSRLTGLQVEEIAKDRVGVALALAEDLRVVVVLKGAHTVVALDDGSFFINSTGNAGMATAGAGDVLTGIIGGLLLQGLSPKDAAVTGVFVHGLAGDMAREVLGAHAIIAGDIIDFLPAALKSLYR